MDPKTLDLSMIDQAKTWLVQNGPDFLLNLLIFVLILIVGAIVIKVIRKTLHVVFKKSGRLNETMQRFLLNVTGKVLWVLVIMIGLPRLGVNVGPLIAGLGVGGFIVGFAFQESLGNLASGMMIVLNQPFKIGDFVDASGHMGTIQEINMMATTMNTPDNKRIVLPNKGVWGNPIVNFSANDTRRIDMTVGISYSSDIDKARQIISDVLKKDGRILDDPAPTVELVELADSSLNIVVRPWCKGADYWDIFFAFNRNIKVAFDEAGIEIPFPQMDVHHHGTGPARV